MARLGTLVWSASGDTSLPNLPRWLLAILPPLFPPPAARSYKKAPQPPLPFSPPTTSTVTAVVLLIVQDLAAVLGFNWIYMYRRLKKKKVSHWRMGPMIHYAVLCLHLARQPPYRSICDMEAANMATLLEFLLQGIVGKINSYRRCLRNFSARLEYFQSCRFGHIQCRPPEVRQCMVDG